MKLELQKKGAYIIKKLIQKVPVGLMIVPLLMSSFINTFFPSIYELGPFAEAFANPYGVNAIMATYLICVGGQLTFKRMKLAFKRGFMLFMSKFLGGLMVCILWLTLFGERGVFGISILALACVLTNQNNSLFTGQMTDYGDEEDLASAAVTALISTPMTTIIAMAMLGLTELNTNSIIDIFMPITTGFMLANLDDSVSDFFGKTQYFMLPFMGFALGSSINLMNIFKGGISGIILGLITIVTGIMFMLPADRKISKRPGYAAIALATTAGNAVASPMIIANLDPKWAPNVEAATTQVAASAVITAIVVPVLSSWWAKKFNRNEKRVD